jgi:hypothetical protein
MNTEPKKSRIAHVPSILAGTAAVIAAASTLYVNLRDDARTPAAIAVPAQVSSVPASNSPSAPSLAAISTEPRRLLLRLDRIQVEDDGSAGSTDWTFQVSADGEPLFSVPMPSLNDKPGQNLARPADRDQASAEVDLPAGSRVALSVKGWKQGWLPGSRAEVTGESALGAGKTVVTVQTDAPKGPRFVLYFSAAPGE